MVNGASIPITDSNWGGSGTQLVYWAIEMVAAAAAEAGAAVHEDILFILGPYCALYNKNNGALPSKVRQACCDTVHSPSSSDDV